MLKESNIKEVMEMKTLKEFLEAFKMKITKSVLLTVIEFLVMKIMY